MPNRIPSYVSNRDRRVPNLLSFPPMRIRILVQSSNPNLAREGGGPQIYIYTEATTMIDV